MNKQIYGTKYIHSFMNKHINLTYSRDKKVKLVIIRAQILQKIHY